MRVKTAFLGLFLVGAGFVYGFLCHRLQLPPASLITTLYHWVRPPGGDRPPPLWYRTRDRRELTPQALAKVTALPYLAGYEPPSGASGVVVNHPELAYKGYNYYTSGHAPEFFLIAMNGQVLHRWSYEPEFVREQIAKEGTAGYIRHAEILSNGDVLALYDPINQERIDRQILVKLDKDSTVLWAYTDGAHHDFQRLGDGRIYVLTREYRTDPDVQDGAEFLDDSITVLTEDGRLIDRLSLAEAFLNSPYATLLKRIKGVDVLHTNTLEVLDGRLAKQLPAFREGNVLVSACHADAIAVVDMSREQVVWAQSGMWQRQHQPTVLANGNILLFDNNRILGFSRVLEFSPLTLEVAWSYEGNADNGFYSRVAGSAMRLGNGNTLITESTAGRAFEVTPDKKIVWEFLNPARTSDGGEELVASLLEMVRLEPDFDLGWLSDSVLPKP